MSDPEQTFADAFNSLLGRAVTYVIDHPSNQPIAPGGLSIPHLLDITEMPEATAALSLARETPSLVPLTWDAGGNAINDARFWVNMTVFPAIIRYMELTSLRTRVKPVVLQRVTTEVINWAKVDPVPVVTTFVVQGISISSRSKYRIGDHAILRSLNEHERQAFAGGAMSLIPLHEGPCIEITEFAPRLQDPQSRPSSVFLQALQLTLNAPVSLGPALVRPGLPAFGLSNLSHIIGGLLSPYAFLHGPQLDARKAAFGRRLMLAFEDLNESDFDLALDLYEAFLHSKSPRERAANIAIALENLYLLDVDGEFTHRFQLHVLTFAPHLPVGDRVTKRVARDLYQARSKVVHGTKPTQDQITLLNGVGASLVRSTLLAIASQEKRKFLRNLGEEVFRKLDRG